MLGGCSAMNFMLYVRGNSRDYDDWAEQGCEGWSWEEVLPYFKKSENNADFKDSPFHSSKGLLGIEQMGDFDSPFVNMIISAAQELGYPKLDDVNGENYLGIVELQGTIRNGARQSVGKAFLSHRPNLHVVKNALVTKIVLEAASAKGVELRLQNGASLVARAKKEVVISAGSVNTPQLLMLSGIGPRNHLDRFGIPTVADLPVGQNLQDHVIVAYFLKLKPQMQRESDVVDQYKQYLQTRSGILSRNGGTHLTLFLNTEQEDSKFPNLQFHYLFFCKNDYNRVLQFLKLMSYENKINQTIYEASTRHDIVMVWITLLKPQSVGQIQLKSASPHDKVRIEAGYLTDADDVRQLVDGLRRQRDFLQTKTFKKHEAVPIRFDIPECNSNYRLDSDEYLRCYISYFSTTIYHPVGTAKMGPIGDKQSVVDPQLKVRGVDSLRVIDASIMPNIVSGNTNAPTIMIGEKGADLIKSDWHMIDQLNVEL